jgi:hypothetical protein
VQQGLLLEGAAVQRRQRESTKSFLHMPNCVYLSYLRKSDSQRLKLLLNFVPLLALFLPMELWWMVE